MNPTQTQTRVRRCRPSSAPPGAVTAAATPMRCTADDQACIGDEHTVELTTEPRVRLAGASTQLETLEAYLLRERDARRPPSRSARVTSRSRA